MKTYTGFKNELFELVAGNPATQPKPVHSDETKKKDMDDLKRHTANVTGRTGDSIGAGHAKAAAAIRAKHGMTEAMLSEPTVVSPNGTKKWYKNGKLDRDGDKPAIEFANGSKHYYKDGKRHREGDKPAIEKADGSKHYYKNGELHRDGDKPAEENADGSKWWYKNGGCHRDGDKPAGINARGKFWHKNGRIEREGGKPAGEFADGRKHWYKDGLLKHRSEAPMPGGKPSWVNEGRLDVAFHTDGEVNGKAYDYHWTDGHSQYADMAKHIHDQNPHLTSDEAEAAEEHHYDNEDGEETKHEINGKHHKVSSDTHAAY